MSCTFVLYEMATLNASLIHSKNSPSAGCRPGCTSSDAKKFRKNYYLSSSNKILPHDKFLCACRWGRHRAICDCKQKPSLQYFRCLFGFGQPISSVEKGAISSRVHAPIVSLEQSTGSASHHYRYASFRILLKFKLAIQAMIDNGQGGELQKGIGSFLAKNRIRPTVAKLNFQSNRLWRNDRLIYLGSGESKSQLGKSY